MKRLNKKELFFSESIVGCFRNSGKLEDIHSEGRISQKEMGEIKDDFRKNIRYHIRLFKEGGLEINWSRNSGMARALKIMKQNKQKK